MTEKMIDVVIEDEEGKPWQEFQMPESLIAEIQISATMMGMTVNEFFNTILRMGIDQTREMANEIIKEKLIQ